MQFDIEKIEKAIVEEVADRLVGEDEISNLVRHEVMKRVDAIWANTVEGQIREVIDGAVRDGFNRPYTKVDSFGRPAGVPTTIGAELEKMIAGYWNARVDTKGEPCFNTYTPTTTRAEWVMMQIVAKDFVGTMQQHVANVGGALKDNLRRELHGTVDRLISDVFRVKSLQDQGKG